QGRRFVDESQGYASFGKATLQQTRQTVALVFDEALRKKEKRIGMSIALVEKAKGGLIEANGCEELARKLGVPAAALRSTLEAFNRAVKADGSALEADPPRRSLASKLDLNGKLYAFFPLTPSITMDYGGLTINTKTQVTEQDGKPIRGLYAAGETVNLYYHDYHGGGILAQCLTFGRIAGQNAAQLAKR
ncbi:MAG: FAD-binding protein, partial [Mesosutterella sp.]|nr:FAD-binding protein [Mesosutterella sp.]